MENHVPCTTEGKRKTNVAKGKKETKIQTGKQKGNHGTHPLPWSHEERVRKAEKSKLPGTQDGICFDSSRMSPDPLPMLRDFAEA